jgi:hypothetical protein
MKLASEDFPFTFLTPCFSGGAAGKNASHCELRVPAMRGQIRCWHRAAFGVEATDRVWGAVAGGVQASRVGLRLLAPVRSDGDFAPVLPHKTDGSGPRAALPEKTTGTLALQRLLSCSNVDWREALEATKLWLLAGTLGFRSARAAGSIWPTGNWAPTERDDLATLLAPLKAKGWQAALIGLSAGKDALVLRKTASDTLGGNPTLFGRAEPREPSPVRFKIVRLGTAFALLALVRLDPSKPTLSLRAAETALKPKSNWSALGAWDPLF